MSHPVRVRGLKLVGDLESDQVKMSHPVRVRGLKQSFSMEAIKTHVAPRAGAWIETVMGKRQISKSIVAPRAGAWIETIIMLWVMMKYVSHPVRVRGLKLFEFEKEDNSTSRTPCGCVD